MTEEWLHLLNIPAASDVKRLREQLARTERQLGRLAKELAERDGRNEEPSRLEDE
jgi:hypothetical protein